MSKYLLYTPGKIPNLHPGHEQTIPTTAKPCLMYIHDVTEVCSIDQTDWLKVEMDANAAGESTNLKYEYITPLDAPGRLTSTSVQRN